MPKEENSGLGKERLKRLAIILAGGLIVFFATVALAKQKSVLPTTEIGKSLERMGEKVLGKTVGVLPVDEGLKKEIQNSSESEPVQIDPAKIIENQTAQIIETLKELPAEQVEKIKKQIFKNFCEEVLKE